MAKRIEMFYGQSLTGKSEALASIIEQMFVQEGLVSRVVIGDGSKATYIDRGLIDAKVVEVLDFSIREWPMTTTKKLCEGYWPEDVNDPKSPLIAPTPESMAKIGVFGVEGAAVMAKYIMGSIKGGLAEQSARGIKIGQDSPIKIVDALYDAKGAIVKDSGPGDVYGGNPMAHFGHAQSHVLTNVERTKAFPNIVIWTSHERAAKDKITGEALVGPEVAGEALTANLSRHFNNTLHFATVGKVTKEKDQHSEKMVGDLDVEFRIYTRDHFNGDGTSFVKYKAGSRGGVTEKLGMPLYLTSEVPGQSILEFYQKIADARKNRTTSILDRRAAVVEKKAAEAA